MCTHHSCFPPPPPKSYLMPLFHNSQHPTKKEEACLVIKRHLGSMPSFNSFHVVLQASYLVNTAEKLGYKKQQVVFTFWIWLPWGSEEEVLGPWSLATPEVAKLQNDLKTKVFFQQTQLFATAPHRKQKHSTTSFLHLTSLGFGFPCISSLQVRFPPTRLYSI